MTSGRAPGSLAATRERGQLPSPGFTHGHGPLARMLDLQTPDVGALLAELRAGDSSALPRLFPLLYDELERAARLQRRACSDAETLATTALVLIALDDALRKLATRSERQSRIVERRFFGGMSIQETTDASAVSPALVKREWAMPQAWLCRELTEGIGR